MIDFKARIWHSKTVNAPVKQYLERATINENVEIYIQKTNVAKSRLLPERLFQKREGKLTHE